MWINFSVIRTRMTMKSSSSRYWKRRSPLLQNQRRPRKQQRPQYLCQLLSNSPRELHRIYLVPLKLSSNLKILCKGQSLYLPRSCRFQLPLIKCLSRFKNCLRIIALTKKKKSNSLEERPSPTRLILPPGSWRSLGRSMASTLMMIQTIMMRT